MHTSSEMYTPRPPPIITPKTVEHQINVGIKYVLLFEVFFASANI